MTWVLVWQLVALVAGTGLFVCVWVSVTADSIIKAYWKERTQHEMRVGVRR